MHDFTKTGRLLLAIGCLAAAAGLLAAPRIDFEQTKTAAKQAEDLAKRFEDRFDHELDKSILDGLDAEDRLDERAEKLRSKLDDVSDEAKEGDDEELREELQDAMSMAYDINKAMLSHRFSQRLEDDWRALRERLNFLAGEYSLDLLPGDGVRPPRF